MNILLCNERFLFRFGADRVLMLLGHGLKDRGHRIYIMANKFDRSIVEGFADKIIKVPEDSESYLNLNEFTAQWLKAKWVTLFNDDNRPDVVVIGGWPFLLAIEFFREIGVPVVFSDFGVVPVESYSGGHRAVLDKLVELRRRHLEKANAIVGISQFIVKSQSCVDSSKSTEVVAILCGADHMSRSLWNWTSIGKYTQGTYATNQSVTQGRENGKKMILNLGRWEPGCYKNSEAIFKFVDEIEPVVPQISILILADPQQTEIPATYRDKIIPIGFPDDAELQAIMNQVDLGVSLSLWEGFNLPLAEMQWLDKPVLAFNVGAHPEVIIHPWFLCQDLAEMVHKAIELLRGGGLDRETLRKASERFHENFKCEDVVTKYEALLERVASVCNEAYPITVLVDVTNASRDPANSGVIRVTRRLCRELQRFCQPQFVVWGGEDRGYVFPTRSEYHQLSQFNGPVIGAQILTSPDDNRLRLSDAAVVTSDTPAWLLLTETVLEVNGRHIRDYAKRLGMKICAIFYDAIAVLRPDLVTDKIIRDNHAFYMKGLAKCDLVIPISQFSAKQLQEFWSVEKIVGCDVRPNLLPGEFAGVERATAVEKMLPLKIDILCVSTLEPRKNHRKLIEAVTLFAHQHPEVDWSLTLIGNKYAGGDDIAEFVERACRDNPRIRWLGIVDDNRLHQAYAECTFSIYASEIEGFGIPILESLWNGKPCICHDQGVMSELAAEGGCLTVDVRDILKLAGAIGELATNGLLYARLVEEATTRPIKTWKEYANDFWDELTKHTPSTTTVNQHASERQTLNIDANHAAPSWQDVLYSGCLTKEWQMNDSERLAMAAVLHRLKPKCAIEIGTYRGGSLSLISQYANVVFSIDIDSSIPEKFKDFANVSFFTGLSQVILPTLLQELNKAGMPVEFVLIDGDHSAAGVKRDIEIMLDYAPKKPLIVMIHDGFNPECRRGMQEADWQRSPYVQYVDIDFIPGRVIEHGGGGDGEMWGGLAMAYFSPARRNGNVYVGATARRYFTEMKNRRYR
jgi:glycosyltransferase involved in cell wall biosynthesis